MNGHVTALAGTRDMVYVHDVFRRALADAPGQVTSVEDGDGERARALTPSKTRWQRPEAGHPDFPNDKRWACVFSAMAATSERQQRRTK
jgi:hypothetical protein